MRNTESVASGVRSSTTGTDSFFPWRFTFPSREMLRAAASLGKGSIPEIRLKIICINYSFSLLSEKLVILKFYRLHYRSFLVVICYFWYRI